MCTFYKDGGFDFVVVGFNETVLLKTIDWTVSDDFGKRIQLLNYKCALTYTCIEGLVFVFDFLWLKWSLINILLGYRRKSCNGRPLHDSRDFYYKIIKLIFINTSFTCSLLIQVPVCLNQYKFTWSLYRMSVIPGGS